MENVNLEQQRIIAAALNRLTKLKLTDCFDPSDLDSRPTKEQKRFFKDINRYSYRVARGGNQCLAEGTLVLTDRGPVAIEHVKVGMTVYDENGEPISVKAVYRNGPKEVRKLTHRNKTLVEATDNHVFLTTKGELKVADFTEDTKIVRTSITSPIKTSVTVKVSEETRTANTYDIHVDSLTNLYLLANGLVTHNSGKTQVGARELSWLFLEEHPYFQKPKAWADEPMLFIVAGRTTKQIEETIWRKIRAFLPDGTFKEHRIGTQIQKVTNTTNGNTILFMSHHSINEAREKIQSFEAHYVWIDEMPGSMKFIEEATKRIISKNGKFIMTLTPKAVNLQIQTWVDSLTAPYGDLYVFKMFDNPIYTGDRQNSILASLKGLPEAYVRSVLEGSWLTSEQAVYQFDAEKMVEKPEGYGPSWRHVEAVDPALKSKFGFTVWAENPSSGVWYCVKAEYLKDIYVPEEMLTAVLKKTEGLNVIRRVADPGGGGAWFIGMASGKGYTYLTPHKKTERKGELIKNLQSALSSGKIKIAPWCEDLIDEFSSCQWSETAENKIINASSYHLLDSAQYFVDVKPKYEGAVSHMSWTEKLLRANEKRKAKAAAQDKGVKTKWKVQKKRTAWR